MGGRFLDTSSVESARTLFTDAGVRVAQFTCGMGVPANLAIDAEIFSERLVHLPRWAVLARNVGCDRGSFLLDCRQGGKMLTSGAVVERARAVAFVLREYGLGSSFGLVDADLLQMAATVWDGIAEAGAGLLIRRVLALSVPVSAHRG